MKEVTILIPTYERVNALTATLTSLAMQSYQNFDIVIADQSIDDGVKKDETLKAVYRFLQNHGCSISIFKNLPRVGLAQQRHFLLNKSHSRFSLFLDDDLLLEPFVLQNLVHTIKDEGCGFVGCAPIGLRYMNDYRPEQEHIELWDRNVMPEKIAVGGKKWNRYQLHNAANLYHVEQKMHVTPMHPFKYKVAWIGACVLYNTEKLHKIGGFSFWKDLPIKHCGEDVAAQLRVMEKYGGCGLIPSGVYHQELPTKIPDRSINAPEYMRY